MMTTTNTTTTNTNTNTTTTNTNDTNNDANDADATTTTTAQPPQPPQPTHEQPLPHEPRERKPKWMRAPTPFEKQRGARLILEAAGLLRPRRRVVDVDAVDVDAVAVDGSSSGAAAAVVVEAAEAAAVVVVAGEEEVDEERAAWRAMMALHRRLRAPAVVVAIRRLFPALVAQAMWQEAPDTMMATTTDGDKKKYNMTALPDAFVLAQHPHCFLVRRRRSGGSGEGQDEGEDEGEEEALNSARMMVDAGAALAETFEVLLNEFRLRPRRRYDHHNDDAPNEEGRELLLLLQLRAYQDAVVAAVVSKKAAAPTRASSPSIIISSI